MSRRLPSERTTAWQRNRVASVADRLTDDTLADLRRRAGEPVRRGTDGIWQPAPLEDGAGHGHHDGYPPGGEGGPTSKGEHGDPTFARAQADARGDGKQPDTWQPVADPIGDNIHEAFEIMEQMADLAVKLDKRLDFVFSAERASRGRQSTLQGVCLVCDTTVTGVGNDRLRAGYCCADYSAWIRSEHYDRGDHLRFRRQRRKEIRDKQRDEGAA